MINTELVTYSISSRQPFIIQTQTQVQVDLTPNAILKPFPSSLYKTLNETFKIILAGAKDGRGNRWEEQQVGGATGGRGMSKIIKKKQYFLKTYRYFSG